MLLQGVLIIETACSSIARNQRSGMLKAENEAEWTV